MPKAPSFSGSPYGGYGGQGQAPAVAKSQTSAAGLSVQGKGGSKGFKIPSKAEEEALRAVFETAIDQLEAYEPELRRTALSTFAAEGERSAPHVSAVAGCLEDEESAEVRRGAALALGKIGKASAPYAKQLAKALADEDASVRAEACIALSHIGVEAGVPFADKVAKLAKDPEEVGLAAVKTLADFGKAVLLADFTASTSPNVRRTALLELGRSKEAREKHAGLIIKCLKDQDASVRLAAVQASGEIGSAVADDHLMALLQMKSDERQAKVRKSAVQALGKCGEKASEYIAEFFSDSDDGVRHMAAETLGAVGGTEAAAAAASSLVASDPNARHMAVLSLSKMRSQEEGLAYAGEIAKLLQDNELAVCLAAIQALKDLHASNQASAIGDLSVSDNPNAKGMRMSAASALAMMGEEGAQQALRFFDDPEPAVRQNAVRVFSPLHSKLAPEISRKYIENVAQLLKDEDWRVRMHSATALGDLHAAGFATQLGLLSDDDDGQVRRAAVTALDKMGKQGIAPVARFLEDPDPKVRQDAERVSRTLNSDSAVQYDDAELSEPDWIFHQALQLS